MPTTEELPSTFLVTEDFTAFSRKTTTREQTTATSFIPDKTEGPQTKMPFSSDEYGYPYSSEEYDFDWCRPFCKKGMKKLKH